MAPSNTGISIPNDAGLVGGGSAMATDDPSWAGNGSANGGARSPPPRDPPRRSSRSRSPGAHREKNDRGGRGDGQHNPGNNLHVSGLSHRVDTRDLEAAFAKIGRVQKASVMYDPHTRESRGFGFVTMETAEEADAAITALNATDLMGKVMNVEKARRGRARTPTPGRYYGPPKRFDDGPAVERPYDPRPYDSRYSRDAEPDRRGGRGRHDDYRRDARDGRDGRDYDRGGYRDYDRGDRGERGGDRGDRGGYGGRHDDRERRYDDRRY
ncbi:hypothetical protein PC9H_002838 [Pleurotus ostreatus]|uniref:RRM domain-containing protein n=2 Tax=Pleurotus ostreatus TaxID=5322 RepID=A0A067P596_PLEO1|nr:uncharacterized protein PC9H_002838 [Pleurotus ostreatus]KAF7436012.1 hypothetical protein PC9H_002838 [Pleurotus ostreatus]KDQ31587.1 hypothetical protein PLEOSDRAFT_173268 [Pleurotus ostreatus PC15]